MNKNIPHTLADFVSSFCIEHRRHPTLQEIFDAGAKASQNIQLSENMALLTGKEQSDSMQWLSPEVVMQAVKDSGLVSQYSCCNTPLKFCDTDMWRGELRTYSAHLLRIVLGRVKKQEIPTE